MLLPYVLQRTYFAAGRQREALPTPCGAQLHVCALRPLRRRRRGDGARPLWRAPTRGRLSAVSPCRIVRIAHKRAHFLDGGVAAPSRCHVHAQRDTALLRLDAPLTDRAAYRPRSQDESARGTRALAGRGSIHWSLGISLRKKRHP
jgi:hypothetical protein